MARVKVCRLCGHQNGSDELFCAASDCGASLADVSVVDSSEIAQGAQEAAPGVVEGDGSGGGEGGRSQAADAGHPTARDGATAGAAPCTLVFPWGRVPVAGRFGVGREAGFSPISGRLDAFSTVSRRHAVVGAAEGRWTVQDLGSTNGTYVNDRRLAAGETTPIQNGDQVGFSRGLQVQVEIGAEAEGTG